jgi:hypothetical protein
MVHYMTKPQRVEVALADTAAPGDIQMELEAMHVVESAIGGLRDQDARLRILNWAMERFHPDFAKAVNGAPMPEAADADLDLFADDLDGLFEKATPVKVAPQSMDNLDGLFEIDAPVVTIGPRPVENLDGLFEIAARQVENLDGLFEIAAPVVKVAAPVVKVAAPVVKVDAPVVKVDAPVVKVDAPDVKVDAPDVKVDAPDVKLDAPVVKLDAPVVKLDAPVVKIDAPVVKVGPRSMGNVVRLFEIDAPVGNISPQSGQSQPELGSLFRELVADLQQLANEMQGG